MNYSNLEDLNALYPVDIDGYEAAAQWDAEELHFTLEGKAVTGHGGSQ